MIMRLALAVYTRPLADDPKAVELLEKVPPNHPLYPKALLVQSYIREGWCTIDNEFAQRLLTCTTSDEEIKSLLVFMAARSYYESNEDYYVELLEQSIKLSNQYVKNYIDLGHHFLMIKDYPKAQYLFLKGMQNIQSVGCGYLSDDITDIDEFIDSYIKGTILSQPLFNIFIKELLKTVSVTS